MSEIELIVSPKRSVQVFDDFAPDAADVRIGVINGRFESKKGPDGANYTGISTYPVPLWFELISSFIGARITPRLSCFRLNLAGEIPHSWVHSDDICAKYASVLYLNRPEQCNGGTAFWKHKDLKIDRLPSRKHLQKDDINDVEFYKRMDIDWKILRLWELNGFIGMKWNRFITYPTSMFHSRYPFTAFGHGPSDGRLIWVCFYDIEGEK